MGGAGQGTSTARLGELKGLARCTGRPEVPSRACLRYSMWWPWRVATWLMRGFESCLEARGLVGDSS